MDELLLSKPSTLNKQHPFDSTSLITSEAPTSSQSFVRPMTTPCSSFPSILLIANLNSKKAQIAHRSHSAPSLFTDTREPSPGAIGNQPVSRSTPVIVRQAFIGLILYIVAGLVVYVVTSGSFKGDSTYRLVDGLYFSVVTLCTIGYGDIAPETTFTKLFTAVFILIGFGFVDILLNGLVTYVLDQQEALLMNTVDHNKRNALFRTYVMDMKKGRMRIRMKVGLALSVVIGCITVGTVMVHALEGLSWIDCFYLSVTSVTTVGYGDYAFKTVEGRLFAIVWLLLSTLAVARAFLYLTELRIDRRNRRIAKWVLQKAMTPGDLVAADLDNDGSIRYGLIHIIQDEVNVLFYLEK